MAKNIRSKKKKTEKSKDYCKAKTKSDFKLFRNVLKTRCFSFVVVFGLLGFFFCLESVYTREGRRWGLKSWTEETWNIFVAENSPFAIWAMTTFDPNQ